MFALKKGKKINLTWLSDKHHLSEFYYSMFLSGVSKASFLNTVSTFEDS